MDAIPVRSEIEVLSHEVRSSGAPCNSVLSSWVGFRRAQSDLRLRPEPFLNDSCFKS